MRGRGAAVVVAAVAAAGCRQGGGIGGVPLVDTREPPAYPALAAAWPPAPRIGEVGRGVAPAYAAPAAITADVATPPPWVDRVWQVPRGVDEPALAVVAGRLGEQFSVEVIELDAGHRRWLDLSACGGPVEHVTAEVVVCGGGRGLAALRVDDGRVAWRAPWRFAGADGALVLGRTGAADDRDPAPGRFAVLAAADGVVLAEGAPPPGVAGASLRRPCARDGGYEVWAWTTTLTRFTVGGSAPAVVEELPLGRAPARVEPCGEPALVELPRPGSAERELLAVRRGPLAVAGGPVVERGFWRGVDGALVVATADGVVQLDAGLAPGRRLSDAQVGRELASRGRLRLVRGAAGRPVLLRDDVPVAQLSGPVSADSAALGDRHVLGGGWLAPAFSLADRVQRFLLPALDAPRPIPPLLAPPPAWPPTVRPDLPDERAAAAPPVELPGVGMTTVGPVLLGPADPATLYVATLDGVPGPAVGAGLAAFDLRAGHWRWHAAAACPPGTPVALAAARDVLVCGARGAAAGTGAVRAVARLDGATRWTWSATTVDAVAAAGGVVVVVVGRQAHVLDAATGDELGRLAADDGFVPRVAPASVRGTDVVAVVERGGVTARLPRAGMLPAWSVGVRGVVVALSTVGERLAVELHDGELALLDPGSGAAQIAAGWAERWTPSAELALAERGGDEPALAAFDDRGVPRLVLAPLLPTPWAVGARAPGAPLPLAYGPALRTVAVVDPRTGAVAARAALPRRAIVGGAFSTVVDGAVVTGAVLARPLAVVRF